jgi:hypothetical protein
MTIGIFKESLIPGSIERYVSKTLGYLSVNPQIAEVFYRYQGFG